MNKKSKETLSVSIIPGFHPEIGRTLWRLQETRQRTLKVLKKADDLQINTLLPGEFYNVSSLLYHVAAIELSWLLEDIMEQPFPPEAEKFFPYPVRNEHNHLTIIENVPLKDHYKRLSFVRDIFLDTFREVSLEEFRRLRHLPDYDVTPEWVLHHLIQHEAEHRNEITRLLKLTGAATGTTKTED